MRFFPRLLLSVALSCQALTSVAEAQDTEATIAEAETEQEATEAQEAEVRWFARGTFDAGFLYLRPRLSLGYGSPFGSWFGMDGNPIISTQGFGFYPGLRAVVGWFDLRVGARYFFALRRHFLRPRESFDRDQLDSTAGPPSRHWSLEFEATVSPTLGPGNLVGEFSGTYMANVPDDYYAFEETLRVITDAEIWRGTLGYLFHFGDDGQFRVGPFAQAIYVPGREAWTLRAGIKAHYQLWQDLALRAVVMPTIQSPDTLGATGADLFLVGVRYTVITE